MSARPQPFFSKEPSQSIFACPPGMSFAAAVADGLRARFSDAPPDAISRVTIYVNAARMRDRIRARFLESPAGFLPRLRLITDLPLDLGQDSLAAPTGSLRRRLELRQMVSRLVEQDPGIAPLSAVPDLSDSLFALIEEMADEGVTHDDIAALDVTDESGHWARAQKFLEIVTNFVGPGANENCGTAEWLRRAALTLTERWETAPPKDPIIIAGSTGSRGTTNMLMRAAAQTENCALILPGFDRHMPKDVWTRLGAEEPAEDHPQYRYASLMADLDVSPDDVAEWHGGISNIQSDRNAVLSLSLRPAPVTNQWISDAKHLAHVQQAMSGVTLIEAPDARVEALSIALAMREAVEQGLTAALITPDPDLTRMVSVALARWKIVPDASMGQPFGQSPPGRLMRLILRLGQGAPEIADLLSLLKHPLAHSGAKRGEHLTLTRQFELWLRQKFVPFVEPRHVTDFATRSDSDMAADWADWVITTVLARPLPRRSSMEAFCAAHFTLASALCAGSQPDAEDHELWAQRAGDVLRTFHTELTTAAPHGGAMSAAEYAGLFENLMKGREVRDTITSHPGVMIWGTLEARVQTADRVILGGLNDGIWPETAAADPWLNRPLRRDAGLLIPDRKIGLSAHDYQIAAAAPEVFLTRSLRSSDAETVPSRWINRLSNLLKGMSDEGKATFEAMQTRGARWTELATRLEQPAGSVDAEPRPAPIVPVEKRPRRISVTDIKKINEDPYAIYARKVLRLDAIPPIYPRPDARVKGIAIHAIAETGLKAFDPSGVAEDEIRKFAAIASDIISKEVPWPETRALWQSQLAAITPELLRQEADRRSSADIALTESKGVLKQKDGQTELVCKADRIDRTEAGDVVLYDFKTGSLPSGNAIGQTEVQLLLAALVASEGGFKDLGPVTPIALAYLAIKRGLDERRKDIDADTIDRISTELETFFAAFFDPGHGMVSRRIKSKYDGDYDHLARLGEWVDGDEIVKEDLT